MNPVEVWLHMNNCTPFAYDAWVGSAKVEYRQRCLAEQQDFTEWLTEQLAALGRCWSAKRFQKPSVHAHSEYRSPKDQEGLSKWIEGSTISVSTITSVKIISGSVILPVQAWSTFGVRPWYGPLSPIYHGWMTETTLACALEEVHSLVTGEKRRVGEGG